MNTPLFLSNLALTVALVCLSLWTGKRGVRPAHYWTVAITVVSLLFAIMQAEMYGRNYTFIAWKLNVHLVFATSCLISLGPLVWSGLELRNDPGARKSHKRWIRVFLVLLGVTVLTACTLFFGAVEG